MFKTAYFISTLLGMMLTLTSSAQTDTLRIFVSPNGDDSNLGTAEAPLKSFQQSIKSLVLLRNRCPSKPVVVTFNGGEYNIQQTIKINNIISKLQSVPVIFRAKSGERPIFTGNVRLTKWKHLNNTSINKRLCKGISKHLFVVDLKDCGVTDFGNALSENNRPDLYNNGSLQTLSRWPNVGFTHTGKACGKTPTDAVWSHFTGTKEGVLEYCDDRINKWAAETDYKLHAYWFWDWLDNYSPANIDKDKHLFYVSGSKFGYKDGLRYYGANLLCELDSVTEWYLDRNDGKLYWYAPKGIDFNNSIVTLTNLNVPYMLEINHCSNITFEGLTFRGSRGSGISIINSTNCNISKCNIEEFGCDAINIEGGNDNVIYHCRIQDIGAKGIIAECGDRRNLTSANLRLERNIIRRFSNYIHTYNAAINFSGCGLMLSNNHISFAPSSAMRLDGNDIIVQFNEIDNVVQESDDQGGIDTFIDLAMRGLIIRYNYWHDINCGTYCGAAGVRLDDMISGVNVYGNVFFKCGSQHFGGIQIHGGKDNTIEDNIFVCCPYAVTHTPYSQMAWTESYNDPLQRKCIREITDIDSPTFLNRWPELKHVADDINFNIVRNNLLINTDNLFRENNDSSLFVISNNRKQTINNPIVHINEICTDKYLRPLGIKSIPFAEIGTLWDNDYFER
jgi:hypothetical protein